MATDPNAATIERLRTVYENESLEDLARGVYELSADDVVQEWPQSGSGSAGATMPRRSTTTTRR